MVYRKECCKVVEYIQNVNFKWSSPMIMGLDAFTNHFLVFGWNVILILCEFKLWCCHRSSQGWTVLAIITK
jgi:hypothetical protein